jgi:hypothetical protein
MFSLKVNSKNVNNRFSLENLVQVLNQQKCKLTESRIEIEPDMYDAYLQQREIVHKQAPREAKFDHFSLYPGTWYFKSIDEKYRRDYAKKPSENNSQANFELSAVAIHLNKKMSNI